MTILMVAVLIFTVVVGVSLWFYWVAFFPCIVLKSRLEIQKVFDETQLAALDGKISAESRGFIELQYFLDLERRAVCHPDMLAIGPMRKPTDYDLEDIDRRINTIMQASLEIRQAFMRSQRWILALWLAARPMWLFWHGLLLGLGLFSDWAAGIAEREEKEVFAVASGLPSVDHPQKISTAVAS